MRKELVAKLDKLVSEYVRRSRANENGLAYCYTCGARKHWKDLDCGHYRSRRFMQTRFDFDNMRPQCWECNRYKHGNLDIYRQKLVKELGEDKVREIEYRPYHKYMDFELEEQIKEVQKNLNALDGLYYI